VSHSAHTVSLVRPVATRWFIAPSFAVMGIPGIAFLLPAAAMAIAAAVGLKLPRQLAIGGRGFPERPTEAELVRR
jgi:hypothetical protein